MLISRRSDPTKAKAGSGWLLLASMLIATPVAADTLATKQADPAWFRKAREAIAASATGGGMPAVKPRIEFRGAPFPLESKAGWAVPFTARYATLGNAYCRVAIVDSSGRKAVMVDLPPAGLHDSCVAMGPILRVDVDGDGRADLVLGITLRSNVALVEVGEAMVYLSRIDRASGFCYAPAASAAFEPADLASAAAVRAKAEAIGGRLGSRAWSCDP